MAPWCLYYKPCLAGISQNLILFLKSAYHESRINGGNDSSLLGIVPRECLQTGNKSYGMGSFFAGPVLV